MRREAERIWQDQKDKKAAAWSLRAKINGLLGTRIFPEVVTQHMKDISAIVFRRQPNRSWFSANGPTSPARTTVKIQALVLSS